MQISRVAVPSEPGPIAVNIGCPRTPQALAGILKRYLPDKTPEGKVGEFLPNFPTIQIGSLEAIKDHLFLIKGAVIAMGDNPPSPYEVQVSVFFAGTLIHVEVPVDGGTGAVGKEDQGFVYRFQIVGQS